MGKKEIHPEDFCQRCHGRNPCWHASNELWNKVMQSPNGIICPVCFEQLAGAMGIKTHCVLLPVSDSVILESQLQLLQECEKIKIEEIDHIRYFWVTNGTLPSNQSLLTVIKSYLESKGK